jgi:hypothetical protein
MTAATLPLACGNPKLMKEQPFDGPGDDTRDDRLVWPPFVLNWIMDAKSRKRRRMAAPVYVLRGLAGATRVGTDRRVNDKDADVRIIDMPAIKEAAREIDNSNAILLADRPQRTFPNAPPPGMSDQPKTRACRAKAPVLLFDR